MEGVLHYTMNLGYNIDNQNGTTTANVVSTSKDVYTGIIEIERQTKLLPTEGKKKDATNSVVFELCIQG